MSRFDFAEEQLEALVTAQHAAAEKYRQKRIEAGIPAPKGYARPDAAFLEESRSLRRLVAEESVPRAALVWDEHLAIDPLSPLFQHLLEERQIELNISFNTVEREILKMKSLKNAMLLDPRLVGKNGQPYLPSYVGRSLHLIKETLKDPETRQTLRRYTQRILRHVPRLALSR